MSHRVTLIPGDGTGPEIAEATRRVLEATGVEFDWDVQEAGADVMEQHGGNPLPDHVIDVDQATTASRSRARSRRRSGSGFRSVNVGLRKSLDLYAQVRPCKYYPGVRTRYADAGVDLVIVRENTEDLYAGIEFERGIGGRGRDRGDHRAAHRRPHPRRLGHLDQADLRGRHPAGRRVRLRLRPPERPPQGDLGAQGEHHEAHRRAVARGVAPGRRRELRHRVRRPDRGQHVHAARAEARAVRRARAAEPLRRHRLRPRAPASSAGSGSPRARTSAPPARCSSPPTARRPSTRARTRSIRSR